MFYLYTITDILNNKVYVGQTVRPKERWWQHKSYSKREKPPQYIQRAMKKYGTDNFVYDVIAICQLQEDADYLEEELINQYDSRNKEKGYNISIGADPAWNRGLPKEQQPMYGKKQSKYFLQRMSEVHSGKTFTHSEETKQKISQSAMGHITSDTTKHKMSKKHIGKILSDETKKKISSSNKGKRNAAKLNWELVNEIRKEYATGKISQAKLGKKYSISGTNVFDIIHYNIWIR